MSQKAQRPSNEALASLPVAVDAMGGDQAPGEIVAGARRAADEGIPVVLVGPPDQVGDTAGLDLVACTEVIAMHEDPAQGVRRKKDSSLVRAAELVRDGRASAMVSAGNTGATMASALLADGPAPRRCPAVHRHPVAPARSGPGRAGRRRSQRRVHLRHARPVRPDGRGLRRRPLRHRRPVRRPALDRRGADQGHAAREGGPCPPGRPRRRRALRRQRRGPRPAAVAGRRGRHRRLHRQRGA